MEHTKGLAMEPVLETRSLVRAFMMGETKVCALDNISFSVMPGDFLSIMGPSGSGKTTLLNLLGCFDRPTSGEVLVGGRAVSSLSDRELDRIRLLRIGFVFQRINLIPILTAVENIELPLEIAGVEREERRRRAAELLESVGLTHRAGHRPAQLSAGEQQRVGIARALANKPDVLMADEPTGNLDSKTAGEIIALLRTLNEKSGQTLIIVTHDPAVGSVARRKLVLRDGRFDLSA
jgi:putative ABC transport system ATP-binding protein